MLTHLPIVGYMDSFHGLAVIHDVTSNIFLKDFILERGKGSGKGGEKHQCVVASCAPLTGDLASNHE